MCDVIESGTMGAVSYSHSIVTMVLSRIISDIKRRIGRKSRFFTPPAFAAPLRGGGTVKVLPYCLLLKTRMVWLPDGEKKFENMFSRFDTIHERDGRTDGRTDGQTMA